MHDMMLKSSRNRNPHFREHVTERLGESIRVLQSVLSEHTDPESLVHLQYALRRLHAVREQCNTVGFKRKDARVIACSIHNQFLVDDLPADCRSRLRQVQEVLDRELSGSYWMKCVLERRMSTAVVLLAVRR